MPGKARSACSGTIEPSASRANGRRRAARISRLPIAGLRRASGGAALPPSDQQQGDRQQSQRRKPSRRRGEQSGCRQQNGRGQSDPQARIIDVLDVLHIVGQAVLVAELPAGGAGYRGLRHRQEQSRATLDLVEQGGAMSRDTFAIFGECLAQCKQPDKGRRRMKIESKRGRSSPASATAPRNQADRPVSRMPEAKAATASRMASGHGDLRARKPALACRRDDRSRD